MLDWLAQTGSSGIPGTATLMISMDIEGAEYEIVSAWSNELLSSFRVFTLELHALHLLWRPDFHAMFFGFIDRLCTHHDIVHAHFNNGTVYTIHEHLGPLYGCIEITLLHKCMRKCVPEPISELPHRLDITNVQAKAPADMRLLRRVVTRLNPN
jgi:hypothetical protein